MREWRNGNFVNFKYAKGKTDIYGRMFHDYYEIYMLLDGEVEFINNHLKQKLNPFQVVVIPPGEYHQFAVYGDIENYERCVINIYPEIAEKNILKSALSDRELLSFTENDRIIKNFLYLTDCLNDVSKTDFSYILSAVATDIVFLIKNSTDTKEIQTGNLSQLSLKLMDYINEHFREELDLKILSSLFYCSVSSLCHTFKKDFGISIKKYIIQKRLTASHIALQKGKKPEEVSIKFGFSNYSSFYRDYKKHFGVAPSQTYKKPSA